MLTSLTIKKYAIIDELELEFANGLTALTGETGAGKSILLGALGLVLGDRADAGNVNQSSDHADITASFDIHRVEQASDWLKNQELDDNSECLLRRRVSRDGRSRAFINGNPVNVQTLRELGEMLIDIHGQHEHQSLMKPQAQRQLLDNYSGHRDMTDEVANAFKRVATIEKELNLLRQDNTDKSNRIDLLSFQVQELEALDMEDNEYQELNEQHGRIANAEKIITVLNQAAEDCYSNDESNVISVLSHHISALSAVAELDPEIQPAIDMLEEARVNIDESIDLVRNIADSIESDPAELARIEQRIQALLDLSRKHHVDPDNLPEVLERLSSELNNIKHADEKLVELQSAYEQSLKQYRQSAASLSESRIRSARELGKQITSAMQTLGMKGGEFEVEVSCDESLIALNGFDRIEFLVNANAGQSCKPLSKTASGGELARISLAIQMIAASQCSIPTMIFDEVDSGVGGGIAEIVGQQLRLLGAANQVICITHLPQVASQAHQHLRVQKHAESGTTRTRVYPLNEVERVEEIARMLSGVEITSKSLAHAEDMITRAQAV